MEKTNAKPGDYVEIHLTKLIYEGVFLESPETEKGTVLLKLDSGYNIGFNKKEILKIVVVKKAKEKSLENFEIKKELLVLPIIILLIKPKSFMVYSLFIKFSFCEKFFE